MDEEKSLMKVPQVEGTVQKADDEAFEGATQSDAYMSYIQLMTSNATKCKTGEFPVNHWALVSNGNHKSLGLEVDVAVLSWRPRAFEMTDDGIFSVYNTKDPEFARISAKADSSNDPGEMYGPEFLLWIPQISKFVTALFGTKSARKEAPNLRARMEMAATLKSHLIKGRKFSWQAPLITACTAELSPLPSDEDLLEQVTKFKNPPKEERETVKPEKGEGAEVER